jgi:hypothetical protein
MPPSRPLTIDKAGKCKSNALIPPPTLAMYSSREVLSFVIGQSSGRHRSIGGGSDHPAPINRARHSATTASNSS